MYVEFYRTVSMADLNCMKKFAVDFATEIEVSFIEMLCVFLMRYQIGLSNSMNPKWRAAFVES